MTALPFLPVATRSSSRKPRPIPRASGAARGARRLQRKLRDLVASTAIELRLRWVKGHQKGAGTESYLNNECDLLAGQARRAVRATGRGPRGR